MFLRLFNNSIIPFQIDVDKNKWIGNKIDMFKIQKFCHHQPIQLPKKSQRLLL